MRNLKVGRKLFVGFAIVVALTIALGAFSIYALVRVDTSHSDSYNENAIPLPYITEIVDNLGQLRLEVRNAVIYDVGSAEYQQSLAQVETYRNGVQQALQNYEPFISDAEEQQIFSEVTSLYHDQLVPVAEAILAESAADSTTNLTSLMAQCNDIGAQITDKLDALSENAVASGTATQQETLALVTSSIRLYLIILVVAVLATVIVARVIIKSITYPLGVLNDMMQLIGGSGTLEFNESDFSHVMALMENRDEFGEVLRSYGAMIQHFMGLSEQLKQVANGDLTVQVELRSGSDTMGLAIQAMVENLNKRFLEISQASDQVSMASKQIAQGAQDLAQGTTEQSAAVEEVSASLAGIAAQAEDSMHEAEQASQDTQQAGEYMQVSMTSLEKMTAAMEAINESSSNISKVIKVIDDIAFQTNILALNAAVEAARAGQHGKGFAVVADEVRSLASKSAEAAKETAGLIETSVAKVTEGRGIVQETNENMQKVAEIAGKTFVSMGRINESAKVQSLSISEITQGVEQISTVTQSNAASSEESAASAEEMSSQAQMMAQIVSQFKLRGEVMLTSAAPHLIGS